MRIVVIGAGRVGTALGVLLRDAGHEIVAASGRSSTAERLETHLPGVPLVADVDAATQGDLVLVTVPDDALAATIERIAPAIQEGRWVAHTSGAAGLEPLAPVVRAGGRRLALHPLQTFPTVDAALASIPGCIVAVTADDEEGAMLGESLARDLGAHPFRLPEALRPLYHAAAVFASNYLVATTAIARDLFAGAGVPDPIAAMLPLQRATLENLVRLGPEAALTGPAVRGDAGTIEANLEALSAHAPETVPAYVALCRVSLGLGRGSGRLLEDARLRVEEVLRRWS